MSTQRNRARAQQDEMNIDETAVASISTIGNDDDLEPSEQQSYLLTLSEELGEGGSVRPTQMLSLIHI